MKVGRRKGKQTIVVDVYMPIPLQTLHIIRSVILKLQHLIIVKAFAYIQTQLNLFPLPFYVLSNG